MQASTSHGSDTKAQLPMLTPMGVGRVLGLPEAVHSSLLKAASINSRGDEAARLAMALLLLASLKAAGVAALLPLAYDSLLAAAVAMVPPGAAAELVLRG